jgi:hypothetical protein
MFMLIHSVKRHVPYFNLSFKTDGLKYRWLCIANFKARIFAVVKVARYLRYRTHAALDPIQYRILSGGTNILIFLCGSITRSAMELDGGVSILRT